MNFDPCGQQNSRVKWKPDIKQTSFFGGREVVFLGEGGRLYFLRREVVFFSKLKILQLVG